MKSARLVFKKGTTTLREHCMQKRLTESHDEAVSAVAEMEFEIGKILYEFFLASFHFILQLRGLHGEKIFTLKENECLGIQTPVLRYPETLVYLETVVEKGVNFLMADNLDAFLFEERDRFGNTIVFMYRIHGFPSIVPSTLLLKDEILRDLKSNCITLLMDLKSTLSGMPRITNPNAFRWKIELGLKRLDTADSKWKQNKQGIFDTDPDWRRFPWGRATLPESKNPKQLSQEVSSPPVAKENKMMTTPDKPNEQSKKPEEEASRNSFHYVSLEDDLGTGTRHTEEASDGLSVIEYNDEDNTSNNLDVFASTVKGGSSAGCSKTFHLDSSCFPKSNISGADSSDLSLMSPRKDAANGSETEHDSSTEDFKTATNIFEDLDDFSCLDKVLEISEENDIPFEEFTQPSTQNSDSLKFFVVATSKLLDTVLCNILAFQEIPCDG